MWWSNSNKEPEKSPKSEVASSSSKDTAPTKDGSSKAFDPNSLPERQKLKPSLQKIVDQADREDNFYDQLVDGYAPESTESNVRYAGYAARLRTIMLSAHRYVAYTSDIGESFRPVAHPYLVKGAYGVSWLYILGDVSHEGYKAYWQNQRTRNPQIALTAHQQRILGSDATSASPTNLEPGVVTPLEDYRTVMAQRAIFQSLASMGLPAFTIHSVVRYSGRALKEVKNKNIRTWAPIGLGLAVVPFLPSLFDKPVEDAVEWTFHKAFATVGGKQTVGDAPATGRERQLTEKVKEKEL
ncbi:hypothetical protein MCOR25_002820 [Pyricularia grisea]|uniref:Mitochondrial fission process protein 1 n=1 Tax=Pyricularia grisea TaxID=148305 RepID=A0A6P8B9U5_PYRGI|nr:uncharacterized protein PgNI_03785 [Pyricularia grisea]KAI6376185.1 hypothetical protein MCOR25_002820 [Pyricularia grisea]TLD12581.1 hypothetical protein PgNI_03785 [Pyricularia grisea]